MAQSRNEEILQAILNDELLSNFTPESRVEAYLKACLNKTGTADLPTPESRIDHLLYELVEVMSNGTTPTISNIAKVIDKSITTLTAEDLAGATKIGDYAFYNLKTLTSIEIPSSVTKICNRSFAYCTSLTSITIPASVQEIEGNSFKYCDALTNVLIEATNITIGAEAFNNGTTTNKATITLLSTTPPSIQANSFDATKLNKIIVPAGCAETYKVASNWTNFADYIEEAAA